MLHPSHFKEECV